MGNTLNDPASNPLISMLVLGASPQGGQNLAALQAIPFLREKMGLANEEARLKLGQEKFAAGMQSAAFGGPDPNTGINWNSGMPPEELAQKYPQLAGLMGGRGDSSASANSSSALSPMALAFMPPNLRPFIVPSKNYLIDGTRKLALTDAEVVQLRQSGHDVAEAGPATEPVLGTGQANIRGTVGNAPGALDAIRAANAAASGGTEAGKFPFVGPTAQAQAAGTLAGNPNWSAPFNTYDATTGQPITIQTQPGGGVRQPMLPGILTGRPFSELPPASKAAQEKSATTAVEKNYALRDEIAKNAQQADEDLPIFNSMLAARKIFTGAGKFGELKSDVLGAMQSLVPQDVMDAMKGGDKFAAANVIKAGAAKLASDLRSPGQRLTQQEIMNLYLPSAGGLEMPNNAATGLFKSRMANAQKWQNLRNIATQNTDENGALKPGFYQQVQNGYDLANKEQAQITAEMERNGFNFGGKQPRPSPGQVVNGYRFKGGDPNKQSSYEKVAP